MKKVISTENAPKAIGPYSQSVFSGDLLFLSGQIAIDPDAGKITSSDPGEQAKRVMENLGAILRQAGMGFENIVKTTIYLTSLDNFKIVNEVYGKYFDKDPPARATVEVSNLPLGALVEIEAIARKGSA